MSGEEKGVRNEWHCRLRRKDLGRGAIFGGAHTRGIGTTGAVAGEFRGRSFAN